jgi:hypothetical protein
MNSTQQILDGGKVDRMLAPYGVLPNEKMRMSRVLKVKRGVLGIII